MISATTHPATEAGIASDAMIAVSGLTKTFGKRDRRVTAVDDLSLTITRGEIFGLVGPDGAGKTTTMRLLAGILRADAGTINVAGVDVIAKPDAVKDRIAYMAQRFALYPDLTVLENLRFYADLYRVPRRDLEVKTDELLCFTRMSPFRKRRAGNLSGGMKQKLALACALIHTPTVLLLDEPTNGVDPVSRRDFWRILYQLVRDGVTIFVSTAYLDEAERSTRVGLMHHGRLLACDTPVGVKKLVPGTLLEVRCDSPRVAQSVLATALPDANVGLFGSTVHVRTTDPDAAEPLIKRELRAIGCAVASIAAITPTLEDAFFAVIEGEAATREQRA